MGMCRGHDPFFQASRRSLAYQLPSLRPLWCPPFSNFRKIFHFQPCFGQSFSSQDANFPNFRSKTPHFSRKICSLDPTFGNPCGTHPPKKVECPPRYLFMKCASLFIQNTLFFTSYAKHLYLNMQNYMFCISICFCICKSIYPIYKIYSFANVYGFSMQQRHQTCAAILIQVQTMLTKMALQQIYQHSYSSSLANNNKNIDQFGSFS